MPRYRIDQCAIPEANTLGYHSQQTALSESHAGFPVGGGKMIAAFNAAGTASPYILAVGTIGTVTTAAVPPIYEGTARAWPTYERFLALARDWRDATRFSSDLTEIYLHPAYQRIIGMGPVALSWILDELEAEGGLWFWALEMIADENPAADVEPGDVEAMRQAWLAWAGRLVPHQ